MNYIRSNKEAWEEAFDQRTPNWGENIVKRIESEKYPFFEDEMISVLERYDFRDKVLAQFCSNNGRELLSLVKTANAKMGYGFDIADNQVCFANEKAIELQVPCTFISTNVLDIGKEHEKRFDSIMITIGALCWFRELEPFFQKAFECLKEQGTLIIHEQHPVTNMLAAADEDNYDKVHPADLKNPYFSKEWIGNEGIFYITRKAYRSKTFISFSHPLSRIINTVLNTGFLLRSFHEYDKDISGMFTELTGKQIPLSFILEAEKSNIDLARPILHRD